jgi:hypothetical protein
MECDQTMSGLGSRSHAFSPEDHAFRLAFEEVRIAPEAFNHRAHVRLAYVYLVDHDTEAACTRMRAALLGFLEHWKIAPAKYHETLTRAWILAVRHFMERSVGAADADAFIAANPVLLDTTIMLTHYSAALLFSPEARGGFVEPDVSPIPRYPERRG